jgi:hypothetical protein
LPVAQETGLRMTRTVADFADKDALCTTTAGSMNKVADAGSPAKSALRAPSTRLCKLTVRPFYFMPRANQSCGPRTSGIGRWICRTKPSSSTSPAALRG